MFFGDAYKQAKVRRDSTLQKTFSIMPAIASSAFKSTPLEQLDIDKLTLSPLSTATKGSSMVFSNIREESSRALLLVFDAVVVKDPEDGDYGLTMRVSPSMDNIERMLRLENMLDPPTPKRLAELKVSAIPHEHRGTLDDNLQLRLKLKSIDDCWRFLCSNPAFVPGATDVQRGSRVRVTASVGFYFNNEDFKYGLFYTLKELLFIGEGGDGVGSS